MCGGICHRCKWYSRVAYQTGRKHYGYIEPQAFLDLWCWCVAVGHSLKLSPGGIPKSIPCLRFSVTQPPWCEVRQWENGLALERESGEGKDKSETEIWGRAQPLLLLMGACLVKEGGRIPAAEAGHARSRSKPSFSGLCHQQSKPQGCYPQLPTPSPSSVLSQPFEKQPGLSLSFKIYLEMQCLFLPCLKTAGCGRGYLPLLPLRLRPFGMTIIKKKEWTCSVNGWFSEQDHRQPPDSLVWRRKISWVNDTWPHAQSAQPCFSNYLESNTLNNST